MKFRLIIDTEAEESVVVTAKEASELTERIRQLVQGGAATDRIAVYADEEIRLLAFAEIACITVLDGKTYVIDIKNRRFWLKQRLYEIEQLLPPWFIRINKSAIANERQLERFSVSFSGAVDAVFRCGYKEYVSRRCFAQIKRRLEGK